jgi:protein-S-isoprenylcysteine O-methyltransferase Ste14
MSVVSGAFGLAAYFYGFWSLLNFFFWLVDVPMSDQIQLYFLRRRIDAGVVELDLQDAALWNLSLFLLFAMAHVLFARYRFKQFLEKYFYGYKFERSMYLVQSGLLLQLMMMYWAPMPLLYSHKYAELELFLEKILPTIGFIIIVVSTFQIDHFELFGLKQAWEIQIPKVSFVQTGFYKYVRHPVMTGMFLVINANAFKSYGRLLLAVIMDLFILIAVGLFEEPELVRTLGKKYTNYQNSTPAFIPFTKTQKNIKKKE